MSHLTSHFPGEVSLFGSGCPDTGFPTLFWSLSGVFFGSGCPDTGFPILLWSLSVVIFGLGCPDTGFKTLVWRRSGGFLGCWWGAGGSRGG